MDVRRRRFDVKPNTQHFSYERNHRVENPVSTLLPIQFSKKKTFIYVEWRNSTPHFASTPERRNEKYKFK